MKKYNNQNKNYTDLTQQQLTDGRWVSKPKNRSVEIMESEEYRKELKKH